VDLFDDLRLRGASKSEAAKAVGRSAAWASGRDVPTLSERKGLHHEARRALEDFEFFRRAYLGHKSLPWHLELVEALERWTATADKEFGNANEPPGSGKTTTLLDYLTWRIVRNRRVRCLYGTKAGKMAEDAVSLVRRYLDASVPVEPDAADIEAGVAVLPWRVLAEDFGSFKPLTRDVPWKATGFSVEQYDGKALPFKEPNLSAYGRNSGFLGGRYDVVVWDDLDDQETTATPEQIRKQRDFWDKTCESRLQPNGVMVLVGQRIAAADLHRYVQDKTFLDAEGIEQPKYHHVVFPAHFDEQCTGNHDRVEARPWPHGCLLDPYRLPWLGKGGLAQIQQNSPEVFEVWYQQRDGDPEGALVRDVWLTGGVDSYDDGKVVPGCYDTDRAYGVLPSGLSKRDSVRIAAVDPSAAKHWAVNDVVAVRNGCRFVIDTFDGRMSADELLDWDHEMGEFKGLMHRWQVRSIEQGFPIKLWVVETNAAQRYLLAYDHVRRWCQRYKVMIWPHQTTGKNKLDVEMGPTILRDPHRAGLYRYARGDIASVRKTEIIASQLTSFGLGSERTDQVMSLWMVESKIPQAMPTPKPLPTLPRPSWQRRRAS
jgi:hypothetical protein